MLRRRGSAGGRSTGPGGDADRAAADAALRAWVAALPAEWAAPVHDALGSRDRFRALVAGAPAGPTRDWLQGLTPTVDQAVRRVADSVWRAMNAASMAAGLSASAATDALKAARRDLEVARRAGVGVDAAQERVQAMAERHRAVNDALNLADDAVARLGELNVRLDTAVARATTVVLRATTEGTDDLGREFDEVLVGLSAIDDALAEFGE